EAPGDRAAGRGQEDRQRAGERGGAIADPEQHVSPQAACRAPEAELRQAKTSATPITRPAQGSARVSSRAPRPIAVPIVPKTSMKPAVVTPPTSSARLTASALRRAPSSATTRRAR